MHAGEGGCHLDGLRSGELVTTFDRSGQWLPTVYSLVLGPRGGFSFSSPDPSPFLHPTQPRLPSDGFPDYSRLATFRHLAPCLTREPDY